MPSTIGKSAYLSKKIKAEEADIRQLKNEIYAILEELMKLVRASTEMKPINNKYVFALVDKLEAALADFCKKYPHLDVLRMTRKLYHFVMVQNFLNSDFYHWVMNTEKKAFMLICLLDMLNKKLTGDDYHGAVDKFTVINRPKLYRYLRKELMHY
jgi:hypothetical protein